MRESKKCRRSPWRPSYAMLHSTTFKRGTSYIGIVAGVLGLRYLVDADMDERIIRSGKRRIMLGPCFSAAAILLSFFDARLSLRVYVLFLIIFLLRGRIRPILASS